MRIARLSTISLLLVLASLGCEDRTIASGEYLCSQQNECPWGWSCDQGADRCVQPDQPGGQLTAEVGQLPDLGGLCAAEPAPLWDSADVIDGWKQLDLAEVLWTGDRYAAVQVEEDPDGYEVVTLRTFDADGGQLSKRHQVSPKYPPARSIIDPRLLSGFSTSLPSLLSLVAASWDGSRLQVYWARDARIHLRAVDLDGAPEADAQFVAQMAVGQPAFFHGATPNGYAWFWTEALRPKPQEGPAFRLRSRLSSTVWTEEPRYAGPGFDLQDLNLAYRQGGLAAHDDGYAFLWSNLPTDWDNLSRDSDARTAEIRASANNQIYLSSFDRSGKPVAQPQTLAKGLQLALDERSAWALRLTSPECPEDTLALMPSSSTVSSNSSPEVGGPRRMAWLGDGIGIALSHREQGVVLMRANADKVGDPVTLPDKWLGAPVVVRSNENQLAVLASRYSPWQEALDAANTCNGQHVAPDSEALGYVLLVANPATGDVLARLDLRQAIDVGPELYPSSTTVSALVADGEGYGIIWRKDGRTMLTRVAPCGEQ